MQIHNPVLRGFNPDPSIVRVGDDYFIATSTFEWFPGVQIHHSRDLVNWRLLGRALTRQSQLDLRGDPSSGGIWAPCLSYDDGTFYLIYTNVRSSGGAYGGDTHNYLVTATDILGPWSEPAYLNSSGFDPSLFHDDDGRKWLVNMVWDFRPDENPFGGILLQEYSPAERRLVGPVTNIFRGTELGLTEGPHLYKHCDFYYLMTAEGGTSWNHAVTVARALNLRGPYEVDPENPMLTSRNRPELRLQKSGHASLVETSSGETYLAHLCSRPVGAERRCILGRETALQRVRWTDNGWLRIDPDGNAPADVVAAPALPAHPWPERPVRDHFDASTLDVHIQTLRVPADESWLSLTERPSYLRLRGRESPGSVLEQSLVAVRAQAFHCRAETSLDFAPQSFLQLAGLSAWYDSHNHIYLAVTYDAALGRCVRLISVDHAPVKELCAPVAIPPEGSVRLRAVLDHGTLACAYAHGDSAFARIGPDCDATRLSDDYPEGVHRFTGMFFALGAHDMTGGRLAADFDYLDYEELGS